MSEPREALRADLLAFVGAPDPAAFDALADRVVAWQAEHVAPYARLVRARGGLVGGWRTAPRVPTDLFRDVDLAAAGEAAALFRTSGTTVGRRGTRRVPDLTLYHAAMTPPFVAHVLAGDPTRRAWVSLCPKRADAPDSSLAHMVDVLAEGLALGGRPAWCFGPDGLDAAGCWAHLEALADAGEPVIVLTTAFSLMGLLDAAPGRGVALPPGSRMMLTGGFKGRTREVSEAALLDSVGARLGLDPAAIVPEYGMTELTSQAYGRPFEAPPWLRLNVVEPLTLDALPPGHQGLLAPFDLLNLDNVSALLTGDLGTLDDAGRLTLHGRAPGAVLRGCSLTAEELGR